MAPIPPCSPAWPRLDLLILDDWMRDPITTANAQDLLEVLDDRYGRSSILVASQVPVADWFARFPDPTVGDGILDRLVHNAYRLNLSGDSLTKNSGGCPHAVHLIYNDSTSVASLRYWTAWTGFSGRFHRNTHLVW